MLYLHFFAIFCREKVVFLLIWTLFFLLVKHVQSSHLYTKEEIKRILQSFQDFDPSFNVYI